MTSLRAAIIILVASALPAAAQTSTAPAPGSAGQARPSRGPEQSSVSSGAPSATTGQTTGSRNQSPAVKQMNENERKKVEQHGK